MNNPYTDPCSKDFFFLDGVIVTLFPQNLTNTRGSTAMRTLLLKQGILLGIIESYAQSGSHQKTESRKCK